MKEEQQRSQFRELLADLSNSQEILQSASERSKIYKRLEDLYHTKNPKDTFRHYYSDIFSVLSSIQQGGLSGNIDVRKIIIFAFGRT